MSALIENQPEAVPAERPEQDEMNSAGPGNVAAAPPADRPLRLVRAALWGVLLLTMTGVVLVRVLAPKPPSNLPVLFPAATFTLIDQNGREFSSKDLRGKPWAAAFIFTHCADICPRLTGTMAALQKQIPDDVQLVSFSVDPERDTPAALKQYSTLYHADESRWHFVTGPKQQVMEVVAAMKLPFKAADADSPLWHSEKLLLIDAAGNVRGNYGTDQPDDMKRFVSDAAALARDARRG